MKIVDLEIPDVKLVIPNKFGDHRGFFSETYSQKAFAEAGIDMDFVQDNQSLSAERGTVRGMHCQIGEAVQAKLLRVCRGSILDVVVDLRRGSKTYGRHLSVEISAAAWNQIFVPAGFAHGFCTLEDDTEVIYKVDNYYAPDAERGILWCDKDLNIDWPVSVAEAVVSGKDQELPSFVDANLYF